MNSIKRILIPVVLLVISMAYLNNFARSLGQASTNGVRTQSKEVAINSDEVITTERKKIEESMIEAEKIKTAATLIINNANAKLAKNEISVVEAAKIIGEQNYKIEQAEKMLARRVSESVEVVQEVDAQDGYMSQLVSGIQDFGARILAPFTSGYGYTEQEKNVARAIIAELTKQLEKLQVEYSQKIATASNEDKMRLNNEFNIIKQEFNNEIYQQQLITGDAMSTNRKLFWTAVGLAGTVAGGALAKQYYSDEVSENIAPSTVEMTNPVLTTETPSSIIQKTGTPSFAGITGVAAETVGQPIEYSPEEAQAYGPVAEKIGKTIGMTKEQVGQTLGKELTERRYHENPLTPAQMIEKAKEGAVSAYEKGKGFIEELQNDAETPEEYKARVLQATTQGERQAADVAKTNEEWQKKWQMKRSPEEQAQVVSEVNERLYGGGKKVGTTVMAAPQYRTPDENPLALTDKEILRQEQEENELMNSAQNIGASSQQRVADTVSSIDATGLPQRIIVREPQEMPYDL